MQRRVVTLRAREPILIETPCGFIELHKLYKDRRKVEIVLPDGLSIHFDRVSATRSSKYVRETEDGRIVPAYSMLVPTLADDGSLVGTHEPTEMTLEV